MQIEPQYIFFALFTAFIGYFIYRMIKHGGFKGAMFGAGIKHTLGEVSGSGPKMMSTLVRVHELDGASSEKKVGVEFVAKSVGSYQMMPISLSANEARDLAKMLNDAAS